MAMTQEEIKDVAPGRGLGCVECGRQVVNPRKCWCDEGCRGHACEPCMAKIERELDEAGLVHHDAYQEHLNHQPDSLGDLDRAEATWDGFKFPDRAWLLSDRDVWYQNPHYKGPPVPHPEYDA